MKYVGLVILILSSFGMCAWTVSSVHNGQVVLNEQIPHYQVHKRRYMSGKFTIEKPGQTMRVNLRSNLRNQWAYYGVALYRVKDNMVITADDKEIQFYSGYEGGEHWTEGSNSHYFAWKLKKPGEYRVMVYVQQTNSRNVNIRLKVYRDYRENWPMPFITGAWFISIWFFWKAWKND